jgi:hypothetical protein
MLSLRSTPSVSAASILLRGANAAQLRNGREVDGLFRMYTGCRDPRRAGGRCYWYRVRVWKFKIKNTTATAISNWSNRNVGITWYFGEHGVGYGGGPVVETPSGCTDDWDYCTHRPGSAEYAPWAKLAGVLPAFSQFDSRAAIRSIVNHMGSASHELRVETDVRWAGRVAYGIHVSHRAGISATNVLRVSPSQDTLVIQPPGQKQRERHYSFTLYFDARTYALLGIKGPHWGMVLRRQARLSVCRVPEVVYRSLLFSNLLAKPQYCGHG